MLSAIPIRAVEMIPTQKAAIESKNSCIHILGSLSMAAHIGQLNSFPDSIRRTSLISSPQFGHVKNIGPT